MDTVRANRIAFRPRQIRGRTGAQPAGRPARRMADLRSRLARWTFRRLTHTPPTGGVFFVRVPPLGL